MLTARLCLTIINDMLFPDTLQSQFRKKSAHTSDAADGDIILTLVFLKILLQFRTFYIGRCHGPLLSTRLPLPLKVSASESS